jgi:hypothetical protein
MALRRQPSRPPLQVTRRFLALSRVIDRYVDSPTPAPDALDAFRFARPGKLVEVLAEAGAMAPSESPTYRLQVKEELQVAKNPSQQTARCAILTPHVTIRS